MPVKTEVLHSCCSDCESSRAEQKWLCLLLGEEVNKDTFFFKFPFEGYFWKKSHSIFSREFQFAFRHLHAYFSPQRKKNNKMVGTLLDLLN